MKIMIYNVVKMENYPPGKNILLSSDSASLQTGKRFFREWLWVHVFPLDRLTISLLKHKAKDPLWQQHLCKLSVPFTDYYARMPVELLQVPFRKPKGERARLLMISTSFGTNFPSVAFSLITNCLSHLKPTGTTRCVEWENWASCVKATDHKQRTKKLSVWCTHCMW